MGHLKKKESNLFEVYLSFLDVCGLTVHVKSFWWPISTLAGVYSVVLLFVELSVTLLLPLKCWLQLPKGVSSWLVWVCRGCAQVTTPHVATLTRRGKKNVCTWNNAVFQLNKWSCCDSWRNSQRNMARIALFASPSVYTRRVGALLQRRQTW